MKNLLLLKGGKTLQVTDSIQKIQSPLVSSNELIKLINPSSTILQVDHDNLLTTSDVTQVVPFILLYFKKTDVVDRFNYVGAGFSLNELEAPFQILTQADVIVLIQAPFKHEISSIVELQLTQR